MTQLDTTGRIIGSFLIPDAISIPYFTRTKAYDVVIMLTFLMVISFAKLI